MNEKREISLVSHTETDCKDLYTNVDPLVSIDSQNLLSEPKEKRSTSLNILSPYCNQMKY